MRALLYYRAIITYELKEMVFYWRGWLRKSSQTNLFPALSQGRQRREADLKLDKQDLHFN